MHYPFLMNAIYAFAAGHLHWETRSGAVKALAIHYSNLATQGLQEALRIFSKTNADGVLATTLILSWLQNDW